MTRIGLKRAALALVMLVGLLLVVAFVAHYGWSAVARSVAALGFGGFGLFCAYTLAVFVLLGWSWFVIAPGLAVRLLPAFVFGRLLREAGTDTLPFSQVGGFVMGARGATILGVPSAVSLASALVDLGAEVVGQLLFTALGVVVIVACAPKGFPHAVLDPLLALGLGVGILTAGLFIVSQRSGLRMLERFSGRWPASLQAQLAAVQTALLEFYSRPARPVLSVVLHFAAWIAAAGGVWMVLRFMGAPLSFPAVIALESLVYLLRSAAFVVPGALGVLEGGYVLLGPVFGLRPELALGLSLIKRGRDLAIGLPVVLAWQYLEGRRLLTPGAVR